MNREFLESLGLEKDAIDKAMAEHGKALNDTKKELETVTTDRDNLNEQITERDKQLDKLNKVNPDELKEEIERLKKANNKVTTEYQEKLDKQSFDFSLEKELGNAGARNAKAVKANLDMDLIKLADGELTGLTGQLEALKESDDYLFEQEEDGEGSKPNFTTGNHNKGKGSGEPSNLQEALTQHFQQK